MHGFQKASLLLEKRASYCEVGSDQPRHVLHGLFQLQKASNFVKQKKRARFFKKWVSYCEVGSDQSQHVLHVIWVTQSE